MDPERLSVGVIGFEPSADGRTFAYLIDVRYGATKWTLCRRFSQFHSLHNQLFAGAAAALPNPPTKALLRPSDPDIALRRQQLLHKYLLSLLLRPDLRQSLPVTQFLEFEEHTNVCVASARLPVVGEATSLSSKYGVTGLYCLFDGLDSVMLWVSHEDSTPLSRLGKAWGMVEPEMVGAVSVCGLSVRLTVERGVTAFGGTFGASYQDSSGEGMMQFGTTIDYQALSRTPLLDGYLLADWHTTQRVSTCCVHTFLTTGERHFLAGTEMGELLVFSLARDLDTEDQRLVLRLERRLELHIKARILQMIKSDEVLITIGSDNVIKCLALPNTGEGDYLSVTSGKITKPLDKKETLCSFILVPDDFTAVIGTSHGKLLVYSLNQHPPSLIRVYEMVPLIAELETPGPSIKLTPDLILSKEKPNYKERPPVELRVEAMCVGHCSAVFREDEESQQAKVLATSPAFDPTNPIQTTDEARIPASPASSKDRVLYVAAGSLILIFLLEPLLTSTAQLDRTDPLPSHFQARLECPLEPAIDVSALVLDETDLRRPILIAAHYRTLLFWDVKQKSLLQSTEYFSWGRINHILFWNVEQSLTQADGECQRLLVVGTTNQGVQLLDATPLRQQKIWNRGFEALMEKSCQSLAPLRHLQNPTQITGDACSETGSCVDEEADNDILRAFGSAVF
eukprot:Protomagalhaensia_sp_Gyna_25__257@NODE_1120_length_2172_cov_2_562119_g889_i0_p1_GENE_NODE_1120_length_2172_cov_2_562119_g889_i0NODE_1120_length_2172_cov_2_562119_g889_i0_p1_ORF_typecomplete_len681_score96_62PX/PF00787_24/4e15CPSF_A/PF03178_15/0_01CPSF_A/PF03178_15/1_6e02CPSF_A/PF03178_15/1_1e03_NODE_1120_length_2172_cov_2_562119_g889_i01172159